MDVTLTNDSSKTVYVFAGSAPLTVFDVPRPQALKGTAADELNNAYTLNSIQGFTQMRDFYFDGVNQFLELQPTEASSATFIFKISSLDWNNSRPPTRVNLNVELALVANPAVKGSHRTKSLSLNRYDLDSNLSPSGSRPSRSNIYSSDLSRSVASPTQAQGFYHVRIRNVTMSTVSYLVDRGHGWERNSLEPGFVRVHWWTSPRLAVIRPDTSQGVDKSEWILKPMFFDHVIESNDRQSNEIPFYDFQYNANRQLTLR